MDDDPELQAIRARRLAELQKQHGGGMINGPNPTQSQQQQQRQQEEEMRNSILNSILSQEAGARLNTLKAVKPDKAKMVEDILINNARMGRIQGRMSEADLRDLLERVNEQTRRETKVNINRRRHALDSDDELFEDG